VSNKILLIYPANSNTITKRMPLPILYLGEALIKHGYEPILLDMQVDVFSPSILDGVKFVGISTLTGQQIKYSISVAEQIRKLQPNVPIVWGGIHPTLMPEQTMESPLVDYVIRGEGEESFPQLIKALQTGIDLSTVPGLVYKQDNKMCLNQKSLFINFNKYNNLPYDLLSLSKYQTSIRMEYQSSRGCPYGCLFCYNRDFNKFKWRAKDANIVLDELQAIKERFNPTYLTIEDDEFFINKKRAEQIMQGMVERKLCFRWKTSIRIDSINSYDNDMLDLFDKSGFMEFATGAESGSNDTLLLIKKQINKDEILASARKLQQITTTPQYSFMTGFPGETVQDLRKTLDCIDELWKINKKIKVNGLFFATPFPGTGLYDLACSNGYQPPKSLEGWSALSFAESYKVVPYISEEFKRLFIVFSLIIKFKFLWMLSESFLQNRANRSTFKYWAFLIFHILFTPFKLIFNLRWKMRSVALPIDVFLVRLLLEKARI
jgi:anaerobic magnesium-protoporphyrin IX monomethyl ester cyclase